MNCSFSATNDYFIWSPNLIKTIKLLTRPVSEEAEYFWSQSKSVLTLKFFCHDPLSTN